MPQYKWVDKTQPQTLMMATILMYVNAAFGILERFVFFFPIGTVLTLAPIAAAYGIANERKWGYWLGVGLAGLWLVFIVLSIGGIFGVTIGSLFQLLIYGGLMALLLHPQSRNYKRTWFH